MTSTIDHLDDRQKLSYIAAQAADARHLATADASREAAGGDGGGRRTA